MPSWSEILTEVDSYSNVGVELDKKRKEFFDKIHDITGRNVIAYYSGWLKKPDAPHPLRGQRRAEYCLQCKTSFCGRSGKAVQTCLSPRRFQSP